MLPESLSLQHLPPTVACGLPEATGWPVSPIAEFLAQTTVPGLWHVLGDHLLTVGGVGKMCVWWEAQKMPSHTPEDGARGADPGGGALPSLTTHFMHEEMRLKQAQTTHRKLLYLFPDLLQQDGCPPGWVGCGLLVLGMGGPLSRPALWQVRGDCGHWPDHLCALCCHHHRLLHLLLLLFVQDVPPTTP